MPLLNIAVTFLNSSDTMNQLCNVGCSVLNKYCRNISFKIVFHRYWRVVMQDCPQSLCGSFWVRKINFVKTMRIVIRAWFYMESLSRRLAKLNTSPAYCGTLTRKSYEPGSFSIALKMEDKFPLLLVARRRSSSFVGPLPTLCRWEMHYTWYTEWMHVQNYQYLLHKYCPLFSWLSGLRGMYCFR